MSQPDISALMDALRNGNGAAMPGPYPPRPPQPVPGVLRIKVFSFDLAEISGDVITEEVNRWIERMRDRAVAPQPSILPVGARLVVAVLYREVVESSGG